MYTCECKLDVREGTNNKKTKQNKIEEGRKGKWVSYTLYMGYVFIRRVSESGVFKV